MLPSIARRLLQLTPPPRTVSAAPLTTGLLNSVNLFPIESAGPRLLTVTVPALQDRVPVTLMTSLEGETDRFTSTATLPFSVRSLLIVSVPRPPLPAPMVPALWTVTAP